MIQRAKRSKIIQSTTIAQSMYSNSINSIVIHVYKSLIFTWWNSKNDGIVLDYCLEAQINKNKFFYVALHLRIIWIICLRGIPTFWQEAYEKNDTDSKKCQNSTKCSYSTKHSNSTNSIVIHICNCLIFTWWYSKNVKTVLSHMHKNWCFYVALFWIIEQSKVPSIVRSA